MDILIPLNFMCSKLVLVGDPLQLPAVVKSQQAAALGYGQSLFERFDKYFNNCPDQGINDHLKDATITFRCTVSIGYITR